MTKQVGKPLLIGAVGGSVAGLLGVGGGVLLVPMMVGLLGMTQHDAHGTSLAVVMVIAIFAATSYAIFGSVNWTLVAIIGSGSVVGGLLGARLMARVPGRLLQRLFGVLLLLLAVRFLIGV